MKTGGRVITPLGGLDKSLYETPTPEFNRYRRIIAVMVSR